MIERAIQQIRRLGGRADALGACPVCGKPVSAAGDPVKAWSGTYAHRCCASYIPRARRGERASSQRSQRVHSRFTGT